jgi:hypothetical protein
MKKYHAFDEDGLKAHDTKLLRAAAERAEAWYRGEDCGGCGEDCGGHVGVRDCSHIIELRAAIMGDVVKE